MVVCDLFKVAEQGFGIVDDVRFLEEDRVVWVVIVYCVQVVSMMPEGPPFCNFLWWWDVTPVIVD